MTDYSKDLLLNQYLWPLTNPLDKEDLFTSFNFDYLSDRSLITTASLRDSSVTNAKIKSLTADKISAGTIDASLITVTNINANNISSGTINASTIGVTNLNANNISSGTINASTIGVTNLNANNINTGTLNASLVAVSNLNAGSITTGTLDANRIGANTITGSHIAGSTIEADEIATDAIITRTIAGSAITANEIAANAVTADKINVNSLSAITATLGSVSAGTITSSDITITGSGGDFKIRGSTTFRLQDTGGSDQGYIYGRNASPSIVIEPVDGVWVNSSMIVGTSASGLSLSHSQVVAIDKLGFNTSSNSTTSGRLWFYDAGGGNYYWRSRNGSWNGQFDQTAF